MDVNIRIPVFIINLKSREERKEPAVRSLQTSYSLCSPETLSPQKQRGFKLLMLNYFFAYIYGENNITAKPQKCNYDPYTAQWL